jgi:putative ubiquitin-RnfH superfamily antitoxin RatB of RatAB toxin-antitoxin module
MDKEASVQVEVVFARPDRQRIVTLAVPAGTTARQAVALSGLLHGVPEPDMSTCPVGVFGRLVSEDYRLRPGDRVEIYRPLHRDPREARRELAARGFTMDGSSVAKK